MEYPQTHNLPAEAGFSDSTLLIDNNRSAGTFRHFFVLGNLNRVVNFLSKLIPYFSNPIWGSLG